MIHCYILFFDCDDDSRTDTESRASLQPHATATFVFAV